MRLSIQEADAICCVIQRWLGQRHGRLQLYGSRIDDTLKGGDIDLLLVVPTEEDKLAIQASKYDIIIELKTVIGEQKIDFSIIHEKELIEPFWLIALQKSIILFPK